MTLAAMVLTLKIWLLPLPMYAYGKSRVAVGELNQSEVVCIGEGISTDDYVLPQDELSHIVWVMDRYDLLGLGIPFRTLDCAHGKAFTDGGCPMFNGRILFSDKIASSPYETQCTQSFAKRARYSRKLIFYLSFLGLGTLMNVYMVAYHFTCPAHPKFYSTALRKFWIVMHILSGSFEIFCGTAIWFVPSPIYLVRVMVMFSLLHCLTVFAQLRVLFGQKLVTEPLYLFCAIVKLYFAGIVFVNPDCYMRVLGLVAVHHIYVWFRASYQIFEALNILMSVQYTLATLLSGIIVLSLLGRVYVILSIIFVVLYAMLCTCLCSEEMLYAKRKDNQRNFNFRDFGKRPDHMLECEEPTDREKARYIFDFLDKHGDGLLGYADLALAFLSAGLPVADVEAILLSADKDGDKSMNFEEFFESQKLLWEWMHRDLQISLGKAQKDENFEQGVQDWLLRQERRIEKHRTTHRDLKLVGGLCASGPRTEFCNLPASGSLGDIEFPHYSGASARTPFTYASLPMSSS